MADGNCQDREAMIGLSKLSHEKSLLPYVSGEEAFPLLVLQLHKPLLFLQSEAHLHAVVVLSQRGKTLQLRIVTLTG